MAIIFELVLPTTAILTARRPPFPALAYGDHATGMVILIPLAITAHVLIRTIGEQESGE